MQMKTTLIDLISIEICLHFHNTRTHVNHCDSLNGLGGRRDIYAEEWRLFSTLWNAIICLKGRKKERGTSLLPILAYSTVPSARCSFYVLSASYAHPDTHSGDIAVSC